MFSNKCYKISVLDPIFVLHLVHLNRCQFLTPGKKRMTNSSWENKINYYRHFEEARLDSKAMYNQIPEYNTSSPIRPCKVQPVGIISRQMYKCTQKKKQNDEEQRLRQGQSTKAKVCRPPYHYILPNHHWLLHTPFIEQVGGCYKLMACAISHIGGVTVESMARKGGNYSIVSLYTAFA